MSFVSTSIDGKISLQLTRLGAQKRQIGNNSAAQKQKTNFLQN